MKIRIGKQYHLAIKYFIFVVMNTRRNTSMDKYKIVTKKELLEHVQKLKAESDLFTFKALRELDKKDSENDRNLIMKLFMIFIILVILL